MCNDHMLLRPPHAALAHIQEAIKAPAQTQGNNMINPPHHGSPMPAGRAESPAKKRGRPWRATQKRCLPQCIQPTRYVGSASGLCTSHSRHDCIERIDVYCGICAEQSH